MNEAREVVVLRYGHRPGRDDRMTTHVGLTARALGADRVVFPDNAGQSAETVREVTDRFGGPFDAELRADQAAIVREFDGVVVHLTMYGEQVKTLKRTSVRRSESTAGPRTAKPRAAIPRTAGRRGTSSSSSAARRCRGRSTSVPTTTWR